LCALQCMSAESFNHEIGESGEEQTQLIRLHPVRT
jgi:hypothetical protein